MGGGGRDRGRRYNPQPTAKAAGLKVAGSYAWKKTETQDATDAALRQFKSFLNKLTPENYDTLLAKTNCKQIISSPDVLTAVVESVFDTVTQTKTMIEMYTRLCVDLDKLLPTFEVEREPETPTSSSGDEKGRGWWAWRGNAR